MRSVSGQQAASAAMVGAPPTAELIGLYEGPRGFIAISPLGAGGSMRLLLADAASDQLRMLFPVAADSFNAGPEIAKPEPVQAVVRVRRSPAGRVDALVLHRTEKIPDEQARRVALRTVPIAFAGGGTRLVGTLLLPPESRRGPYPAVVLAHGLLGVTGSPSEFATMRGISQLVPGYWEVLTGWLARASQPRTPRD
jgi:hypothetical protein